MVKGRVKYISLLALIFGVCINANVFADSPVDLTLTVGDVLTLSVPNQPQNISITPTATGYYDSTNFNVTSATNNMTGYTLSMSATNTNLVSNTINVVTGEPPVIPTIASSQEGITAEAFAASTDTNILNHYGVSINNANFNAMPSTSTTIKATTTTNSSSADTTNIALATKLDLNTVPGTYSTTINFAIVVNAVDPPQPYPTDPCDTDQNCDSTSGTTIQRAYEMAYTSAHKGMYEEDTAGSNTFHYVDSWNGVQYQGQGRDVRFLIQDMTPEICNTATVIGSTALVLDIRDQTSYRIVKAADGRCWMQDNLALDAVANKANLTATNTNASQDAIDNYKNGGNTKGYAGWSTAAVSYETDSSVDDQPRINVASKDVLPTSYDVYSGSIDEPLASIVTSEKWKVGVYYNYCAASIGTYCYKGWTGVDKANTAIDAEYDICPSGWRMPTGYDYDATDRPDGGEYQALATAITGNSGNVAQDPEDTNGYFSGEPDYTNFRKALRLPLSGFSYHGSSDSRGSEGYFWSSTYDYSYSMHFLLVNDSTIYPQESFDREAAWSVRCINKTGTEPAPSGN